MRSLLKSEGLEPNRLPPSARGAWRGCRQVSGTLRIHVAPIEDVAMKNAHALSISPKSFDLDDLLHPAQAFEHPRNVIADPDLTVNEKRAILASWASDACAVEATPALRCAPGGRQPVSVDEILEALRDLDAQARASSTQPARLHRRVRGTAGLLRPFRRRDDTDPDHGLSAQTHNRAAPNAA